jgi:spermidine/putrescine transport system permease protein
VWDLSGFASISDYWANIRNSLVYGGLATVLGFLIGFPIAYTIALYGGRFRALLLFLVIAPFLVSLILRVISWQQVLGEDGPLLGLLRDMHLVSGNFSIVGTPAAVVGGLTYQLIPFIVLPLYTTLTRIDYTLLDASEDLYAGQWLPNGAVYGGLAGATLGLCLAFGVSESTPSLVAIVACAGLLGGIGSLMVGWVISETFWRVVLPLSAPGVFAAGILSFVPAIGDYVNAELLGGTRSQMLGNVIQQTFLTEGNFPAAAALSILLLAILLAGLFVYLRVIGPERALENVS